MRSRWIRISVAAAAAALFTTGFVLAQQSSSDESKRNKRMNVSGKVKIEVIITPDGKVRSTRVIGGHPLLVQACQDAVKEWKFFPAPEETTQVIEFDFRAGS